MKTCQVSVRLDNVQVVFGTHTALNIDHFEINEGDILGLVGNNGAGKTTMFRVILDLLHPNNGEAKIADIVTSQSEEWKDLTGAYIDNGFLIEYLTPEEYFSFVAKINNISDEELHNRLKRFDSLMNDEVVGKNKLIRNLSAGNMQKVGIIASMLHNPQLIILDEPFNYLDPSSQYAIKHILSEYHKETGATIVISSHNISHTLEICTRVVLLEHGQIIKDYNSGYKNLELELEEYFEKSVHVDENTESGQEMMTGQNNENIITKNAEESLLFVSVGGSAS